MKDNNLPQHIAIIMDGNGRWAKKRGLSRNFGHRAGIKTVEKIIQAASEIGIKVLTLYTFSLENWQRSKQEIDGLMGLLNNFLSKRVEEFNKKNIRLFAIGEINKLPENIQDKLKRAVKLTQKNSGLVLNLALSYGSRTEIVNATKKIARLVKQNKCKINQINEDLLSRHLYTANLGDPDLLIRTSGEMRISNFLLWQISYTELYITDKLWPDFTKNDLLNAINNFKTRKRRFGR